MKLQDYLTPSRVHRLTDSYSKKTVFFEMLQDFSEAYGDEARKLAVDALLHRERESSTGVGDGVALPHAIVPYEGFKETRMYLGVLPDGMDFQAIDEKPVYVIFLILSDEEATWQHLRILARLSRIFCDRELVNKLRKAESVDIIFDIIKDKDSQHV